MVKARNITTRDICPGTADHSSLFSHEPQSSSNVVKQACHCGECILLAVSL